MIKNLPEYVIQWARNVAKKENSIRVEIHFYKDADCTQFKSKSGLTFDWNLEFRGLDGYSISMEKYIIKLLKYCKRYYRIFIDGTDIFEIEQPALPVQEPPAQLPPTITLPEEKP